MFHPVVLGVRRTRQKRHGGLNSLFCGEPTSHNKLPIVVRAEPLRYSHPSGATPLNTAALGLDSEHGALGDLFKPHSINSTTNSNLKSEMLI